MLPSANDRPIPGQINKLRAGVIAVEDEPTNRRRILATDGHLCVHTIGSFGLLGLGHSFHVPQPKIDRMRTGKPGAFGFIKTRLHGERHRQYEYAPAYSEGPAIPMDYRE